MIQQYIAAQYLTVEWLHPWQILLPSHMLSVDLAKIGHEERIFIAWLAGFMIDFLHPLLQGFSNHLFRNIHAIEIDIRAFFEIRIEAGNIWCRFKFSDN